MFKLKVFLYSRKEQLEVEQFTIARKTKDVAGKLIKCMQDLYTEN